MADLLGVAAIIGSSASFLGTAGAIWLQATGRDRHHDNPHADTDDEAIAELAQRIAAKNRRKTGKRHRPHEFRVHIRERAT